MTRKTKPRKARSHAVPDEKIAEALVKCEGRQMHAARMCGLAGPTVWKRIERSPYLQEILKECHETVLDDCEETLSRLRRSDNLGSAIFILKTLGKLRGYVETQPIIVSQDIIKNLEDLKSDIRAAQVNRKKADKNNNSE